MRGAVLIGLRAFGALLVVVIVLFGGCLVQQAALPFNSEGRYFDPNEGIVYEDYRDVLASVTAVSAMLACGAFAGARLLARNSARRPSVSTHVSTS